MRNVSFKKMQSEMCILLFVVDNYSLVFGIEPPEHVVFIEFTKNMMENGFFKSDHYRYLRK